MKKKMERLFEKELTDINRVIYGQNKKLSCDESDLEKLKKDGEEQDDKIKKLLSKAGKICDSVGIEITNQTLATSKTNIQEKAIATKSNLISWEDLIEEYGDIGSEYIFMNELLSPEIINKIECKYSAPLERLKWDKYDYIVVLGAALVGIITDWFCAPVGNPLSEKLLSYGSELHDKGGVYKAYGGFRNKLKDSQLAERFPWVKKISEMKVSHPKIPIDYRGPGFSGKFHRAASGGHDLLRFMSAIWQIKNGQFVGLTLDPDQNVIMVIKSTFDYKSREIPYIPKESWGHAAIEYLLHVTADFFTSQSLPIPGSTYLTELPKNDEFNILVNKMYNNGYNLRHVIGQGVTPAVTSLIVWLYYTLRYKIGNLVNKHILHKEIIEEPVPGLKLNEMTALAHTLVTGINVGRVIITSNPLMLNLPELLICLKQLFGLTLKNIKRYNLEARYERNKIYIEEEWSTLEKYVNMPFIIEDIDWPQKPILIN